MLSLLKFVKGDLIMPKKRRDTRQTIMVVIGVLIILAMLLPSILTIISTF
jgi:predicted nucleic acid-binding Zn ribbon protein